MYRSFYTYLVLWTQSNNCS